MDTLLKYQLLFYCFFLSAMAVMATVKYDEGRVEIDGIQLLQDSEDSNVYYYLTRAVRLSQKDDGSYELLCIKYVGDDEVSSGGLFHALIEFSLPEDVVKSVETKLQEKMGETARIAGPVPMQQYTTDGEKGIGKFDVVSSILTDTEGEQAFTNNVLTSGFAPLLPNSKAAIAAKLNPSGATLLWESLSGPTSDVSVSVHGFYEAVVKGYNATVSGEASTIYEHYSRVSNWQQGFNREQMRRITDEMIQDQTLNVDIFDRSQGLDIETKDMQAILDIVTEQLIELMFDTTTGWAQKPAGEVAVEAGQIKGRQERGWFSNVFGGKDDTEYYSDNQYVRKKREDVRMNKFYLNLSKSTTIKVPVHTSGNIGGFYEGMQNDLRYFRVVNLDDADFQNRNVHFQIDGSFTDAFNDILNSVSVSFKKSYDNGNDVVTDNLIFTATDIAEGKDFKAIDYPRLGISGSDWLNYEYRLSWNLKGQEKPILVPAMPDGWQGDNTSLISLVPPFKKRTIEVDADRTSFKENGIRTATIRFFTVFNGEPLVSKTLILRDGDTENIAKVNLFFDEGEPIAYQATWYSKTAVHEEPLKQLNQDYLFLITPQLSEFNEE